MAARSKRRGRRPAQHVGPADAEQADVNAGNPLISPQDRALFRRALAGPPDSLPESLAVPGIVAADGATRQSALKTPTTVTDAALFAGAVQGVVPLAIDRARPHGQRPPPLPLSAEQLQYASEHSRSTLRDGIMYGGIEGEVAERLWFARPGLQDRVLRKLRRGHMDAQAELDLHGLVVAEAHDAVDDLILEHEGSRHRAGGKELIAGDGDECASCG